MASGPLPFLGAPYRRSLIDDVTGNVTVAPEAQDPNEVVQRGMLLPLGRTRAGDTVLASQAPIHGLGMLAGNLVSSLPDAIPEAISAAQYPGQVWRGEKSVFGPDGHVTDEALGAANGIAGLAMTGSMPFSAPKGAIRMFGGGESLDDILASMEATISKAAPEAPPPGPRMLDPNAKSWDLYHGSTPGPDFQRFDPSLANNPAEQAVFFAPSADTASGYAGSPKAGAEAGSRVFRATVDPGKTGVFDLTHLAETDPAFNARAREITMRDSGATYGPAHDDYMGDFRASRAREQDIARQAAEMGFTANPDHTANVSFGWGHIGAAVERAKAQGLDTAILRNLAEHGGDDQVIALTPGRVRSYYDPSQLLYSGGPAGLVGMPFLGRDR